MPLEQPVIKTDFEMEAILFINIPFKKISWKDQTNLECMFINRLSDGNYLS